MRYFTLILKFVSDILVRIVGCDQKSNLIGTITFALVEMFSKCLAKYFFRDFSMIVPVQLEVSMSKQERSETFFPSEFSLRTFTIHKTEGEGRG